MTRAMFVKCDRCGSSGAEDKVDRSRWGRIFAATLSGSDIVGSAEMADDLCGECLDDLSAFMLAKRRKPAQGEIPVDRNGSTRRKK